MLVTINHLLHKFSIPDFCTINANDFKQEFTISIYPSNNSLKATRLYKIRFANCPVGAW